MRLLTSLPVIVALWLLGYAVALGLMLGLVWLGAVGGAQAMLIALLITVSVVTLPPIVRARIVIRERALFVPAAEGGDDPSRRSRE
jgi:hypothetical protein